VTIAAPSITVTNPVTASAAQAPAAAPAAKHDGFSFSDFLDVINPLQHLPIVSTIYRAITHDQIGTPEKIAGDTLFGGVFGFISSVADSAFESITGKDVGDTVLSLFTGGDGKKAVVPSEKPAPTELALAITPPAKVESEDQPSPGVASGAPTTLPGVAALQAALNKAQIDPTLALRASFAYGQAMALPQSKLPDDAALVF